MWFEREETCSHHSIETEFQTESQNMSTHSMATNFLFHLQFDLCIFVVLFRITWLYNIEGADSVGQADI